MTSDFYYVQFVSYGTPKLLTYEDETRAYMVADDLASIPYSDVAVYDTFIGDPNAEPVYEP